MQLQHLLHFVLALYGLLTLKANCLHSKTHINALSHTALSHTALSQSLAEQLILADHTNASWATRPAFHLLDLYVTSPEPSRLVRRWGQQTIPVYHGLSEMGHTKLDRYVVSLTVAGMPPRQRGSLSTRPDSPFKDTCNCNGLLRSLQEVEDLA